jgi:exopolysaccharide biosynthesis polyprenyl glycosylphosphotransferase
VNFIGNDPPYASGLSRSLAPSRERLRLKLLCALIVADVVILHFAFLLAGLAYLHEWPADTALDSAQLLSPLFVVLAAYQGCYSIASLQSAQTAIRRIVLATAVSTALVLIILFYAKSSEDFSRATFTLGVAFSLPAMMIVRWRVSHLVRRRWKGGVNVLMIEAGGPDIEFPGAIRIDARAHRLLPDDQDPHAANRLGRLFTNMDRVIVACPPEARQQWALALRAAGVRGEVVSEALRELGAIGLANEHHFTALIVSTGPLGLRSRALKRVFDLSIAVACLIILAPLFGLIALAIKLEDGGPVFFFQRRVGRSNCFFEVIKFRSMRTLATDSAGSRSASRDDDRVTRVGRLLRRTSLDELPQLINVVAGDMSLVGPRPHALGSQAGDKLFWEIDSDYWRRHALKPGLTGLAQIRGFRGATEREKDLTDRLGADLEYIAHWSIWSDIWILLNTVRVLVHDRAF